MDTLLLIDTHALVHRFFHALPPLTTPPPRREPIGALYGLSGIFLTIADEEKPAFIAAALDRPEPTFRKEIFHEYKIHRPKAPDELVAQLTRIPEFLNRFGIRAFSLPGFEADDVIGTLVERFKHEEQLRIVILSGDFDVLQLVEDNRVLARIIKTGISDTALYDEAAVKEKYGFPPVFLPDYKGLVGDASDNIPGIEGVGQKTASALLREFSSLEGIYENIALVPPKVAAKLETGKQGAFSSRQLARIVRDAPLPSSRLEELRSRFDRGQLAAYFTELGFTSLVRRLGV